MVFFPDWSDLGSDLPDRQRDSFDAELGRMAKYDVYFSGHIFKETVDEIDPGADVPLMYPVGLNLVKMMVLAHADTTYGEYDRDPLVFSTRDQLEATSNDKDAASIMSSIMQGSQAASLLWETEVERNLYGGGAIKISASLQSRTGVRWSRIPKSQFFPIWDSANPDRFLKVFVFSYMSKEQAALKYKLTIDDEFASYVEEWTSAYYKVTIDGREVDGGINGYGVVPFIYIPRYRLDYWYGESLAEDVMRPQDEINMRIGDVGEAINYNSHPIRWGRNLPGDFNMENYRQLSLPTIFGSFNP